MWARQNLPECVAALAPLHPSGASRADILYGTSADVGLDVTYTLMVRDVAEASGSPYRAAREKVESTLKSMIEKAVEVDPLEAERERIRRSIVSMEKYRRRA